MTLPISTTTITVRRPAVGSDKDPWVVSDDTSDTNVVTGVRAHISTPRGSELNSGGAQENVSFLLNADPCDLHNTDRVYDERTEELYEVIWTEGREALGLDHVVAGLSKVRGTASDATAMAVRNV